jgi:hypothetical protein
MQAALLTQIDLRQSALEALLADAAAQVTEKVFVS